MIAPTPTERPHSMECPVGRRLKRIDATEKQHRMPKAQVVQVIRADLTLRGKGVEGDPVRRVIQYFSLEGELLWEVDADRDRF